MIAPDTAFPSLLLLVNDAQPLEGQVAVDHADGFAHAGHERRKAAGGDHHGCCVHLGRHAADHAVDEPGVAEDDARLDAAGGVLADHPLRGGENLDPRQLRGLHEESLRRDHDARADGAAQVGAVSGNGVEGGGRPEVDDDQAGGILGIRAHRVDDPVGPDFPGIAVKNGHAGRRPGIDPYGGVLQIFPAEGVENVDHGRHHARDDGVVHLRRIDPVPGKQTRYQKVELVLGRILLGPNPPVPHQPTAVVDTHNGVGVADIDHQEHDISSPLRTQVKTRAEGPGVHHRSLHHGGRMALYPGPSALGPGPLLNNRAISSVSNLGQSTGPPSKTARIP